MRTYADDDRMRRQLLEEASRRSGGQNEVQSLSVPNEGEQRGEHQEQRNGRRGRGA